MFHFLKRFLIAAKDNFFSGVLWFVLNIFLAVMISALDLPIELWSEKRYFAETRCRPRWQLESKLRHLDRISNRAMFLFSMCLIFSSSKYHAAWSWLTIIPLCDLKGFSFWTWGTWVRFSASPRCLWTAFPYCDHIRLFDPNLHDKASIFFKVFKSSVSQYLW